jgi:hypothetical protein
MPESANNILYVRLTPQEFEMLDMVRKSNDRGTHTRSAMVRYLIIREHRRRTQGTSVVKESEYGSEHRVGRRKKQ